MDEVRRRQFLQALGIDLWRQRDAAPAATASPVPATAEADPASDARPGPAMPADDVAALDWKALEARVAACRNCPLCENRNRSVFGVGGAAAGWMIVGEAPGAEEDRRGEPFVGAAGRLLDRMLKAVGLDRGEVYITNTVKCRPPGNRDPRDEELAACRVYLERQIALLRPRLLLVVGRVAAQTLLASDLPLGRLRGKVHSLPGHGIPLIATYHPAYLLRTPEQKRRAWQDLLLARSTASDEGGGGAG